MSLYIPGGFIKVNSGERVRQVVFVGHVAAMTQVIVVTYITLPANTTQPILATFVTSDMLVTNT